jgi:hypothetical protein
VTDEDSAEEAECPGTGISKRESFLERIEHHWIEIAAAALMALATIMSAYCAYQSSWWHTREAMHYSDSDQGMIEASDLKDKINQEVAVDINMMSNYINAQSQGDERLAGLYRENAFSDALKKVLPAWEQANASGQPDRPKSPIQMPDYRPKHYYEAKAAEAAARLDAGKAKQAGDDANGYLLLTVLFASVLFFAGIGTKFSTKGLKISVLSMGALIFVASVVILAFLP